VFAENELAELRRMVTTLPVPSWDDIVSHFSYDQRTIQKRLQAMGLVKPRTRSSGPRKYDR
jgi:hypothetical protein